METNAPSQTNSEMTYEDKSQNPFEDLEQASSMNSVHNSNSLLVPGLVLALLLALGLASFFAYQNFRMSNDDVNQTVSETNDTETVVPIVTTNNDSSSWETTSFSFTKLDPYNQTEKTYEARISFSIPQNWSVIEENRETSQIEGQTLHFTDYLISNADNTLEMRFTAVRGGVSEWQQLPPNAQVVTSFTPDASGGAAMGWVVRYFDPTSEKIIYMQALSDVMSTQLQTDTEISNWVSVITEPTGTHRESAFTIEATYTGQDKDIETNLAIADKIVSQMVKTN